MLKIADDYAAIRAAMQRLGLDGEKRAKPVAQGDVTVTTTRQYLGFDPRHPWLIVSDQLERERAEIRAAGLWPTPTPVFTFASRLHTACDNLGAPKEIEARLVWLLKFNPRRSYPTERTRQWFAGSLVPTTSTMQSLAKTLCVDVDWLAGEISC